MNADKLRLVASAIERGDPAHPDLGFSMAVALGETQRPVSVADISCLVDRSGRDCGTVACVAGWTVTLFEPSLIGGLWGAVRAAARRHLDLSHWEADVLFHGHGHPALTLEQIPAADAVAALRRAADTGVASWLVGPVILTISLEYGVPYEQCLHMATMFIHGTLPSVNRMPAWPDMTPSAEQAIYDWAARFKRGDYS